MSVPAPPSYRPAPRTSPSSAAMAANHHLTGGPLWYRHRIRKWGPIVALLIPGLVGGLAYAALRFSDAAWSGPLGLIGAYAGAPALLAVGAPFGEREIYPIAVAASGVMWILIGLLASRRATTNPMATWTDFWRHYLWMLFGVWAGVAIAVGFATVRIGSSVIEW